VVLGMAGCYSRPLSLTKAQLLHDPAESPGGEVVSGCCALCWLLRVMQVPVPTTGLVAWVHFVLSVEGVSGPTRPRLLNGSAWVIAETL
jgi:hypothetical protein